MLKQSTCSTDWFIQPGPIMHFCNKLTRYGWAAQRFWIFCDISHFVHSLKQGFSALALLILWLGPALW